MTQNKTKTHFLVVLDDGETYTVLEGARIVEVTDEAYDRIQNGAKIRHLDKDDGIVKVSFVEYPK